MSKGKLKVSSEDILPIIKKWLYSDKDIFVRELVSNSCDAIQKMLVLNEKGELCLNDDDPFRIDVILNKEAKTISISDNGIGMTAAEVKEYVAQLAFSGAREFIENYKQEDEKDQFIGHFGLGFYSAFMASNLVEIDTLSYKEGERAAHWLCDGSSSYTLKVGKRTTRGTTVTLHIDDEEYLDQRKLQQILSTYCKFLPHPIFLGDHRVNPEDPLWLKQPSDCTDDDYLKFYRELYPMEQDPIFWIHLNVDHPFHLKGVLYFPKITPRFDFHTSNIKLFCNRVFVSDNVRDIFPDFLAVLRGAIDSPDIPLNVSRSYLQMDSTVKKLSNHISKKVSDKLSALYIHEKESFINYWPDIESIVKLGALQNEKFYERAKEFLLWKTVKGEWTTVEEYKNRNKGNNSDKIFYTTQETIESGFLNLYKNKK